MEQCRALVDKLKYDNNISPPRVRWPADVWTEPQRSVRAQSHFRGHNLSTLPFVWVRKSSAGLLWLGLLYYPDGWVVGSSNSYSGLYVTDYWRLGIEKWKSFGILQTSVILRLFFWVDLSRVWLDQVLLDLSMETSSCLIQCWITDIWSVSVCQVMVRSWCAAPMLLDSWVSQQGYHTQQSLYTWRWELRL